MGIGRKPRGDEGPGDFRERIKCLFYVNTHNSANIPNSDLDGGFFSTSPISPPDMLRDD
jgi:hypothetical protein